MGGPLEPMDLPKRQFNELDSAARVGKAYLDITRRQTKAGLFVGQKFLHVFALVTLKLNHLTHDGVDNDGAIASYERCRSAAA